MVNAQAVDGRRDYMLEFFEALIGRYVIVLLNEPDKCFPFTSNDAKFYYNVCKHKKIEPHLIYKKTHLLVELY